MKKKTPAPAGRSGEKLSVDTYSLMGDPSTLSSLASGGSRAECARWLFNRSSLLSPALFLGSLAWDLPCSR
jgi:hypothetical protein